VSALIYARFELRRTFRNGRLLFFSLGFPVVLMFAIAAPNRDATDFLGTGISAPLYYMVGLVGFGAMMALISTGARIATERIEGWTRQLRATPLSAPAYLRAKVITGYGMAAATIVVLYLAGIALGVRLSAESWLAMTGLILIALLPFAALGVLLGHLLTPETIGPAVGGAVSLLALVSGTWFPLGDGFLGDIGQFLPSYWLVQASHVGLGGAAWTPFGWAVVIGWTVLLSALALAAYRREATTS
jgi:ABC-2 type transport system permease protein